MSQVMSADEAPPRKFLSSPSESTWYPGQVMFPARNYGGQVH